jgi:hypothetical protein
MGYESFFQAYQEAARVELLDNVEIPLPTPDAVARYEARKAMPLTVTPLLQHSLKALGLVTLLAKSISRRALSTLVPAMDEEYPCVTSATTLSFAVGHYELQAKQERAEEQVRRTLIGVLHRMRLAHKQGGQYQL